VSTATPGPSGEHAESRPWAYGQAGQASGGLDGEPGGHRPDLLEAPVHARATVEHNFTESTPNGRKRRTDEKSSRTRHVGQRFHVKETSEKCGASYRTVERWKAQPEFKAEIARLRADLISETFGRLVGMSQTATDKLEQHIMSIRATRKVFALVPFPYRLPAPRATPSPPPTRRPAAPPPSSWRRWPRWRPWPTGLRDRGRAVRAVGRVERGP
jgi:hypothetical protein